MRRWNVGDFIQVLQDAMHYPSKKMAIAYIGLYFLNIMRKETIKVEKKEMLKEHKHLIKVLKTGSKPAQKKEARKQSKELKEYR